MEFYKEVVWYWYIFENRTLEDTYKQLTCIWGEQYRQLTTHEGNMEFNTNIQNKLSCATRDIVITHTCKQISSLHILSITIYNETETSKTCYTGIIAI